MSGDHEQPGLDRLSSLSLSCNSDLPDDDNGSKAEKSTTAALHPLTVVPSLPAIDQDQCPLFDLPTELRHMILREVLVSHRYLGDRRMYPEPKSLAQFKRIMRQRQTKKVKLPHKAKHIKATEVQHPKIVRGYRLTPGIIATCQQLAGEGLLLLYGENVLGMAILRHAMWPPPYGHTLDNLGFEVFAYPATRTKFSDARRPDPNLMLQAKSTIACFKRFHIEVVLYSSWCDYDRYRELVQTMAPWFADKTIHLDFANGSDSIQALERTAKIFSIMKCRELTITGVDHIISGALKRVVTSSAAVLDLYSRYQAWLSTSIYMKNLQCSDDGASFWDRQMEKELFGAVQDFDEELFWEVQKELVRGYRERLAKFERRLESFESGLPST